MEPSKLHVGHSTPNQVALFKPWSVMFVLGQNTLLSACLVYKWELVNLIVEIPHFMLNYYFKIEIGDTCKCQPDGLLGL